MTAGSFTFKLTNSSALFRGLEVEMSAVSASVYASIKEEGEAGGKDCTWNDCASDRQS